MRTIKLISLISFLFISHYSTAQLDVNLLGKWDYVPMSNAYEKVNKIIASSNGYTIAVGEIIGAKNKSRTGLFLVLNEDGTVRLRKQFGGKGNCVFNSVTQNFDGTFTLVGYVKSKYNSLKRGWVLQLDMDGNQLFSKVITSSSKGNDELIDVAINKEGTVLAVGEKNDSRTGDVWILRIGNKGIVDRVLGRGELGNVKGIVGANRSFVLVGSTGKSNKRNYQDAWVVKIDKNGEDLWGGAKYFGDSGIQEGLGISKVIEGGYAFVGASNSGGLGEIDKWLVKIDEEGKKEWEQFYGGNAIDIATSVVELSEGGFAILGQTFSHLPRARNSAIDIVITDEKGKALDSDTYMILGAGELMSGERGDEVGNAIVELPNGDIVVAGNTLPEKSNLMPRLLLSASTYKRRNFVASIIDSKKEGSSSSSNAIKVVVSGFFDANSSQTLERAERGYFLLQVSNSGNQNLNNLRGRISSPSGSSMLEYSNTIHLGTIRAGQAKQVIIPVYAKQSLQKGDLILNLVIESYGKALSNSTLVIETYKPDPAKLSITGYFSPAKNPRPNEKISLNVDLLNTGGTPSESFDANFIIPRNLKSLSSQKIKVPRLQPNQPYQLNFTFNYSPIFEGKLITIQFETKGKGNLNFIKTFQLEVDATSVGRGNMGGTNVMFWMSPDPDEQSSKTFSVTSNELDIKLKILSGVQLQKRNFSVLINGRKAQGQKMDEVKLSSPIKEMGRFRQTYFNKIRLKKGTNKIRILYDDGIGNKVASPELIFNYTNAKRPKLYVISLGVPYDNLKFTTKDAMDIANLFEKLKLVPKGFKEVDITPLTSKYETQTMMIKEVFERLGNWSKKIKREDLLVIYISAHGKVNRFGEFLLMPSDYKPEAEKTYSINFENDILDGLKQLNCKKLVFLDACHSGSAFNGQKDWTSGEAASKVMNDLIQSAPGIEIIASCGDNEFSYEDESWGNSAFAKAIIEAFTDQKVLVDGNIIHADIFADSEYSTISGSDGKISIKELKYFIKKRIPYLVKTTKKNPPTGQNPSNKSTDLLSENMGIYYLIK